MSVVRSFQNTNNFLDSKSWASIFVANCENFELGTEMPESYDWVKICFLVHSTHLNCPPRNQLIFYDVVKRFFESVDIVYNAETGSHLKLACLNNSQFWTSWNWHSEWPNEGLISRTRKCLAYKDKPALRLPGHSAKMMQYQIWNCKRKEVFPFRVVSSQKGSRVFPVKCPEKRPANDTSRGRRRGGATLGGGIL